MEKQLEIHIEFPLFYFYMYKDNEFTTAFRHVSGHNEIRKLNQIERLISSIEFKYEAKKKKIVIATFKAQEYIQLARGRPII